MGNPKFEVFNGKRGDFYFRLRAKNGETILTSEGYTSKAGAKNGIKSVKKNARGDKNYTRETAKNGQSFFTLRGGNYKVIGKSETYRSESSRENGIKSVKEVAGKAPVQDDTK
jgi:uncharacterized protein YegP (UPF0339 family)